VDDSGDHQPFHQQQKFFKGEEMVEEDTGDEGGVHDKPQNNLEESSDKYVDLQRRGVAFQSLLL